MRRHSPRRRTRSTVDQPVDEPLETDRDLDKATIEVGRHAIDHRRRDEGLADAHVGPHAAPVCPPNR
jgi:hypothetical protein